ncbi:MAG: hypothetical protein WD491_01095 [Balneolales bacterium]
MGFKPAYFDGYPRGYFLSNSQGVWAFALREGMHRMAALAHLGYKSVPVQFMQHYPRLIQQSDCPKWPMIREGYLSEEQGLDIFMQYLKAPDSGGIVWAPEKKNTLKRVKV